MCSTRATRLRSLRAADIAELQMTGISEFDGTHSGSGLEIFDIIDSSGFRA
jgi:hypothetical protein